MFLFKKCKNKLNLWTNLILQRKWLANFPKHCFAKHSRRMTTNKWHLFVGGHRGPGDKWPPVPPHQRAGPNNNIQNRHIFRQTPKLGQNHARHTLWPNDVKTHHLKLPNSTVAIYRRGLNRIIIIHPWSTIIIGRCANCSKAHPSMTWAYPSATTVYSRNRAKGTKL